MAEMDRRWLEMPAVERLLLVSLKELNLLNRPFQMSEVQLAIANPAFRLKVEARVDQLHRQVEERMMAGEASDV